MAVLSVVRHPVLLVIIGIVKVCTYLQKLVLDCYNDESAWQIIGVSVVSFTLTFRVKVNQSRYRSEVPRGFQEVKVPRLRDNGPGWW